MMARDKSTFGKGDPCGIIACEASNNARDGASMLPTLFLGIPGGPEMAILLGIFLIFGITPGPGMALEHMGLVWTIIICLMLGNVLATVLSIFGAPFLSKITILPITLVTAFTLPLCIASLLSSDSEIWDLATAGILGILGILMKRTGYPVAPVIIGYVLAPLAERSFHTTLQGAYNNPLVFSRAIWRLGLVAAIGLAILFPIFFALRAHFSKNRESVERQGYDWGEETAVGTSYTEGLFMSFIFLAVAVIILVRSPQYTLRESGLWPMTVAIVMLIAVLCVLVPEIRRRLTRKRKKGRGNFLWRISKVSFEPGKNFSRPLGWTLLYIVLNILIGAHAANLFSVFVLLWWLGGMSPIKSVIWSLIVHTCIFIIFSVIFKILLWPGAIPMIIPNVIGGGELSGFF